MTFLIDVHAHLQDEKFEDELEQIITNANKAGIERIINAGCTMSESLEAVQIAKDHECCRALVGVHPHNAKEFNEHTLEAIKLLLDEPSVLGIGEIGLDYHYDFAPRALQIEVFRAQWQLAAELSQPVEIHVREAYDDFFESIKDLPQPPKVLLHCFSGDLDIARKALEYGFHFSIGGALTYPKSEMTRTVFKFLPDSQIHLETDCPYLSPQPKRGKRNEPAYIPMTLDCLSRVRGISPEELSEQLKKNAFDFFGSRLS